MLEEKNPGLVFHRDHETHDSLHDTAFACLNDRFKVPLTDNVKGELLFEQVLPATVEFFENGFVERVRKLSPDVIICDVSSLWGILTAKILKVPLITSCSCTLFDRDVLEAVFGYLRELPASKKAVKWLAEKYDVEYDPVSSYMNESSFLISWSIPVLQPPSRQDDAHVHFFGAAMPVTIETDLEVMIEADRRLGSESVVSFIEKSKKEDPSAKIIYCTIGTVVGQEPWTLAGKKDGDMVADFYNQVIKCLGNRSHYRVILSIGTKRNIEDLGTIPSNFLVRNFVPQLAVLTMSDVFITHCGNNGVHEAFFFGCPMLCVPVFGDQHLNAETIVKMGVGVQIASPFAPAPSPNLDHITAEELCTKLLEVLGTKSKQIQSSCLCIKEEMRRQHEVYHSNGIKEMESFIFKTASQ